MQYPDEITVEAGGVWVTQRWVETRCNHCGIEIGEAEKEERIANERKRERRGA